MSEPRRQRHSCRGNHPHVIQERELGDHTMTTRSTRRSRGNPVFRKVGWLAAASMLAVGTLAPSAALAAGPGNNGADPTGNGTTSAASVGGSWAAGGNSATMNTAKIFCDGDNANSF